MVDEDEEVDSRVYSERRGNISGTSRKRRRSWSDLDSDGPSVKPKNLLVLEVGASIQQRDN